MDWVVQNPIKPTTEKVEFWIEFSNFTVRFSVYYLAVCFEFQ